MTLMYFTLDRRSLLAGVGAAGLAGCATVPPAGSDRFVRRDGMRFTRGGQPYRYAGANAWYLAWLGSDTKYGDRARLGRELDRLQAIGVGNVRLLAGAEESPVRNSIKPASRRRTARSTPHCWPASMWRWPNSASAG